MYVFEIKVALSNNLSFETVNFMVFSYSASSIYTPSFGWLSFTNISLCSLFKRFIFNSHSLFYLIFCQKFWHHSCSFEIISTLTLSCLSAFSLPTWCSYSLLVVSLFFFECSWSRRHQVIVSQESPPTTLLCPLFLIMQHNDLSISFFVVSSFFIRIIQQQLCCLSKVLSSWVPNSSKMLIALPTILLKLVGRNISKLSIPLLWDLSYSFNFISTLFNVLITQYSSSSILVVSSFCPMDFRDTQQQLYSLSLSEVLISQLFSSKMLNTLPITLLSKCWKCFWRV
jgi:hypothetical protein